MKTFCLFLIASAALLASCNKPKTGAAVANPTDCNTPNCSCATDCQCSASCPCKCS